MFYAEPQESETSTLILNMIKFPIAAQRYNQSGLSLTSSSVLQDDNTAMDNGETRFAYEHPSLMDHEALEPTSGRKAWMIRHGKRIKKGIKKDKTGYMGSS
jgi:hypothetical protein